MNMCSMAMRSVMIAAFCAATTPGQIYWVSRNPTPTSSTLTDVVWTGSQYLVVGWQGTVITSKDGVAWNASNSGIVEDLQNVVSSGTVDVAFGSGVYTSPDGNDWAKADWPLEWGPALAMTWTGKEFVAGGYLDSLFHSPDGKTWRAVSSDSIAAPLRRIAYSRKEFVALAGPSDQALLYVSDSAKNWKPLDIGFDSFRGLLWCDSVFLVLGKKDGDDILLRSKDGRTWVGSDALAKRMRKFETRNECAVIAGQGLVCKDTSIVTPIEIRSVFVDAGEIFVAGETGDSLFRSRELENWSSLVKPDDFSSTQVVSANGRAFRLGSLGSIQTSDAQHNWTEHRMLITSQNINSVTLEGPRFVAVGDSGVILFSRTGDSWSKAVSATKHPLRKVLWTGSKYFAFGDSGVIVSSSDGESWSAVATGFSWNLKDAVFGGSKFVAIADSDRIIQSDNGVAWDSKQLRQSDVFQSIAWSGSGFVIAGMGGSILSSTDGSNWNSESLPAQADFEWVVWSGKHFVLASSLYMPVFGVPSTVWRNGKAGFSKPDRLFAWAGGVLGYTEFDRSLLFSSDDSNWVEIGNLPEGDWRWLAGKDSLLVAVAKSGLIATAKATPPKAVGVRRKTDRVETGRLRVVEGSAILDVYEKASYTVELVGLNGQVHTFAKQEFEPGSYSFRLPVGSHHGILRFTRNGKQIQSKLTWWH